MSPLKRIFLSLLPALAIAFAACSEPNDRSAFDPDTGHPEDWLAGHGSQYREGPGDCAACHGEDFRGGISRLSCYSASFNGNACHPGGPPAGGHPAGWGRPGSHGRAAKAAPGASGGFGWCRNCHGSDFTGDSADTSCFPCHEVHAPHPEAPWIGGAFTHTDVNQGNAVVCALCHRSGPGTPGCFNSTLCHGSTGPHPAGWDAPDRHGSAAMSGPGSTSGFAWCQGCHGKNFAGGSAQSCYLSGCHRNNEPHSSGGWGNHPHTNEGNAPVCGLCHRERPGAIGCTNNTMCHGEGDD